MNKANPMRLVVWALVGAAIASSTLFITFIPISRIAGSGSGFGAILWADRLRFVYLIPFVVGVGVWWRTFSWFQREYRSGIWTEEQLHSVRSLVERPFWSSSSLVLFVLGLLFIIVAPHGVGHGGLIFSLMFPAQVAQEVKRTLVPRVTVGGALQDWHTSKPMQSDHWGEAGEV